MAEWTYHISLVITHEDGTRILMLPEGEAWRMPQVTMEGVFKNLFRLSRIVEAELGAYMTVLRTVAQLVNEAAREVQAAWLMENHTQDWAIPEGTRWIDRAALDGLMLVDEWMRPALTQTLDTLMHAPPAARPPWFRAGWYSEAAAWTVATLEAQGYTLVGKPEQYKQGTLSSVLKVETTSGDVYFKMALNLPLFGNEPRLNETLSRLFPDFIPAPLAIDGRRRWMLTADFGSELRGMEAGEEALKRIVQTYARLQISTEGMLEPLFAAGVLDRRLDVLVGQIDGLLADEAAYSRLNADERAAWQASGEQLKVVCAELAAYHLPYTLVHGDMHAGNVALDGERLTYFDWTDACVAHPFFDVPVLVEMDVQTHAEAMRDAYLAEWTAYEPMERLREAYDLAKIAAALHQAVSYQGIVNGMEADQRDSWSTAIPQYVRDILKQLKAREGVSGEGHEQD